MSAVSLVGYALIMAGITFWQARTPNRYRLVSL